MKLAIIGCGIAGLSIANLLKDKYEIVIYEKKNTPGGLIKCERVQDCLFHKVGGHVFNSKNKRVLDWFWSFFDRDKEFIKVNRNAKILFDNKIIGYPIENHLYNLEVPLIRKIITELIELQKQQYLNPLEYANFEVFLKQNFGPTLYELYFKPYNQKIWHTDLNTISMQWLEGKLPMPDLQEIILKNITREAEDNMVHSCFYYPRENGSQFIVDRLKLGLKIVTNTNIREISKREGELVINEEAFNKIVYCGDIRQFPKYGKKILSAAGIDVKYLESLRSNGTSNLFCETDANNISWLYLPENFTAAHRIIYTGNFSDTNNRGKNRKTCVVEFSGKVKYETMVNEIKTLPGNLLPISYNYEPNSYVIQDNRTKTEINAAKQILEKEGIYLLGRFAEWEYYNMDTVIEAAMTLAQKLVA